MRTDSDGVDPLGRPIDDKGPINTNKSRPVERVAPGVIKRKGGQEIEREALTQGPIPVGQSVVTGAGKLRARHVIHAAVMGRDLVTDASLIRSAALSALAKADDLGMKTVAFPALGTGVGGFPLGECARIMRQAILDHAGSGAALEVVELVLFGREAYQEVARALFGE